MFECPLLFFILIISHFSVSENYFTYLPNCNGITGIPFCDEIVSNCLDQVFNQLKQTTFEKYRSLERNKDRNLKRYLNFQDEMLLQL